MTIPLTKLIAENKERPIAEASRKTNSRFLLKIDTCWVVGFWNGFSWEGEDDGLLLYPTHFRPLPDDRLALVTEVLLEALNNLVSKSDDYTPVPLAILIENGRRAIQQATTIAEGKDNAM